MQYITRRALEDKENSEQARGSVWQDIIAINAVGSVDGDYRRISVSDRTSCRVTLQHHGFGQHLDLMTNCQYICLAHAVFLIGHHIELKAHTSLSV